MPLANQLFDNRPIFAAIRGKLRKCLPIIPELQNRSGDRSVEQVLEELQSIDSNNHYWAARQQQFAALKFYFQKIIWSCEDGQTNIAQGVSNYLTLVGYIEEHRCSQEPVILITFNYDSMIERALSCYFDDFRFTAINDYIRRPSYKLFKLHGSMNWGYPILDYAPDPGRQSEDQVIEAIIARADKLAFSDDIFVSEDRPARVDRGEVVFPAISIPVQTKSSFSCPEEWLPLLDDLLEHVNDVLLIGWRGAELHFLKRAVLFLSKNLHRVTIVSDTEQSATETKEHLGSAGLSASYTLIHGGFTEFIVSGMAKTYLRRDGGIG